MPRACVAAHDKPASQQLLFLVKIAGNTQLQQQWVVTQCHTLYFSDHICNQVASICSCEMHMQHTLALSRQLCIYKQCHAEVCVNSGKSPCLLTALQPCKRPFAAFSVNGANATADGTLPVIGASLLRQLALALEVLTMPPPLDLTPKPLQQQASGPVACLHTLQDLSKPHTWHHSLARCWHV